MNFRLLLFVFLFDVLYFKYFQTKQLVQEKYFACDSFTLPFLSQQISVVLMTFNLNDFLRSIMFLSREVVKFLYFQ